MAKTGEMIMWIVFVIVFIVFIGKIIPGFWDELVAGILGMKMAFSKVSK